MTRRICFLSLALLFVTLSGCQEQERPLEPQPEVSWELDMRGLYLVVGDPRPFAG